MDQRGAEEKWPMEDRFWLEVRPPCPSHISQPAEPALHSIASEIAGRLLTYSIDVRRELSLSKSIPLLIMCARIVVHSQGMVEGGSGVVLTWLAVSYFVRLQGEAQRQAISSYVLRNAAPLPGTAAGFLLLDEGYR
ncbi:hypothetical protein TIFTF001_042856 [Ficus carica]|uniref:Uncharacterized protein n=1 Tax=Ficus carica TaxID=3494 RepID=A0AA88CH42_FICCA|nr:hypothetical protein TIFTF001_042853 [Ficus carica]GMN19322.1 hypothetical protein TIFTF001_042854 [Ficus carica]GMN19325.1 hypothetical protein TIFTF001_042855 [Ficus carica]GMN19333.1 hypothetical protein TIFTF001_042856 [Ficus carica]